MSVPVHGFTDHTCHSGNGLLQGHGLILDFASSPVQFILRPLANESDMHELEPVVAVVDRATAQYCETITARGMTEEVVDDCAIPQFSKSQALSYEMPSYATLVLSTLIEEYKDLVQTIPGTQIVSQYFVPTTGTLVRVPPRRVPVNYHNGVEQQLQSMLQAGIIDRTSSPWDGPIGVCTKEVGGDSTLVWITRN